MKTIKLKSRYGQFTFFTKKSKKTWVVKPAGLFVRYGGTSKDDCKSYTFFDPEGGPFISIGDTIDGVGRISKIYHKNKQLLIDVE